MDASGHASKYGGMVYRFGSKYGGNVDDYSPIFEPSERSSTGDTYAGGPLGLAIWFAGLSTLLLFGGYAIISTSQL